MSEVWYNMPSEVTYLKVLSFLFTTLKFQYMWWPVLCLCMVGGFVTFIGMDVIIGRQIFRIFSGKERQIYDMGNRLCSPSPANLYKLFEWLSLLELLFLSVKRAFPTTDMHWEVIS